MRTLVLLALALFAIGACGQSNDAPVAAKSEQVYQSGDKNLVPPQLHMDHIEDDFTKGLKVHALLAFTISSNGTISDIHVLRSDNPDAGKRVVEFVRLHWRFTPATRKGKPVAVRFQANFNLGTD